MLRVAQAELVPFMLILWRLLLSIVIHLTRTALESRYEENTWLSAHPSVCAMRKCTECVWRDKHTTRLSTLPFWFPICDFALSSLFLSLDNYALQLFRMHIYVVASLEYLSEQTRIQGFDVNDISVFDSICAPSLCRWAWSTLWLNCTTSSGRPVVCTLMGTIHFWEDIVDYPRMPPIYRMTEPCSDLFLIRNSFHHSQDWFPLQM